MSMNNNETVYIEWTPEKLRKLKQLYQQHAADPQAVFDFEGYSILSSYAKYLIEYLEMQFNEEPKV